MARVFDGQTDRIDYPNILGGSTSTEGKSFSFSAWVRPQAFAKNRDVFCVHLNTNSSEYYIFIGFTADGKVRYRYYGTAGGNGHWTGTTLTTFPLNTWSHLAFTVSVGVLNLSSAKVFRNGVECSYDTRNYGWTGARNTSGYWTLGGRYFDDTANFEGALSEVAVWTRALSEEEIQSLAIGYSPLSYPADIVFFASLFEDTKDYITGQIGADTGTESYLHYPENIYIPLSYFNQTSYGEGSSSQIPPPYISASGSSVTSTGLPFIIFTSSSSVKPPAYQTFETETMRAAHINLTDDQRADKNNLSDPKWVKIYRDSSQLPKTTFDPAKGEFCYYAINIVGGDFQGDWPKLAAAGIKGVRQDASWAGVQQKLPTQWDYNWSNLESGLNAIRASGGTSVMILAYTPAWANNWMMRQYPPMVPREEVVNLDPDTGEGQLSSKPVVKGQKVFEVVVDSDAPWVQKTNETLATGYFWPYPYGAKTTEYPINPQSTSLTSRTPGGQVTPWTRVHPTLMSYAYDNKYYVADYQGYVRFGDAGFSYESRLSAPSPEETVTMSYEYIPATYRYENGIDYQLDIISGKIKKIPPAAIAASVTSDDFSSSTPKPGWVMGENAPLEWDINTTFPGQLRIRPQVNRSYFSQIISDTNPQSSNWDARILLTTISPIFWQPGDQQSSWKQAGLMVKVDDDNYFQVARTGDANRSKYYYKVNGQTLGGSEIAFNCMPPMWLVIRKRGPTLSAWVSDNMNDWTDPFQDTQPVSVAFTLPTIYEIGPYVQNNPANKTHDIGFDNFYLRLPRMETNSIKVFYYSLDEQAWENYVSGMVTRFKDRVKHWEIWNEPDGGGDFFACPLSLWAEMVKSAYRTIKNQDPQAKVVTGGLQDANTSRFLELYDYGLRKKMDYGAWHPYNFYGNSPDGFLWHTRYFDTPRGINAKAEYGMYLYRDLGRQVFLGEVANTGIVLNGQNYRKQADYTLRMVMMSRRLGYVKSFQYWPYWNYALASDRSGNNYPHGGREGLVYFKTGETGGFTRYPKPVWFTYSAAALNKGIILDLVSYSGTVPEPADPLDHFGVLLPGGYRIKKIILGATLIDKDSVVVKGSMTATSDDYIAPINHGFKYPPNTAETNYSFHVMSPTIGPGASNVKTEVWIGDCSYSGPSPVFRITGSKSGFQGTAIAGQLFTAANQACSFSIPNDVTWATGNRIMFETFRGDGFATLGQQYNVYVTGGSGDIEIGIQEISPGLFPLARYLYITFNKQAEATIGYLDEIKVYDSEDKLVSKNKYYTIEGIIPDPE